MFADASWIKNVYINLPAVNRRAETLASRRGLKKQWQVCVPLEMQGKFLNVMKVLINDICY